MLLGYKKSIPVDKIDFVKRKTTLFLKNNKKYLLYSLVLIVVVSSIFISEKNSFVNQGSVVPTDLLRKAKLGEFPSTPLFLGGGGVRGGPPPVRNSG